MNKIRRGLRQLLRALDDRVVRAVAPAERRLQQFQHLVRQSPMMAIVNMINALILALVVADSASPYVLGGWLAAVCLPSAYNLYRSVRARHKPSPTRVGRGTMRRALIMTGAMGAVWGSAAILFFTPSDLVNQAFLAFILGGMFAGVVAMLSALPAHCMVFGLTTLPPITGVLLATGDRAEMAMAGAFVVFAAALAWAVRNGYHRFLESLAVKRDLSETRHRLLDAIESTREAFALFDADGRPTLTNRRFWDYFPEGRTIGPAAAEPTLEALPDGRWLQSSVRRTADGGFVSVHADITALKRQEAELQRARLEAEEASRAKSQFLAMMSHELRTPLNSIIGFAQILVRDDMTPTPDMTREYAGYVLSSGHHLLALVTDILDLSKIEAGRYELREQLVAPVDIVAEAVRQFAPQAAEQGITLTAEDMADVELWAEARALRQMVINLMSNAVKFTERCGAVRVSSRLLDDGRLELVVADDGIGIAAKEQDAVFEPFRQVDCDLARERSGTGLGLPLVRRLVELHGGETGLDSTVGEGTTVRLIFPADRVVRGDAAAAVSGRGGA